MPKRSLKTVKISKKEEITKNKQEKSSTFKKDNSQNMPIGLYNLGLTCYMNSLLQCFFHINKLRDYLIENRSSYNNDKLISKELANVMYELKCRDKKYYKPTDFKKAIAEKNNLFKGRKAADAKDLFFNLIDSLTNELNDINSKESSTEGELDFRKKEEILKLSEKEFNNSNFVNQLFLGFYETKYLCPVKNKKKPKNNYIYSFQIESFILFELEKIKNYYNKDLSLDLCFKYLTKEDGDEKSSFFCSLCKTTHNNNFQNKIYRPPEVLIIILDRGRGKKFKGKVEFGKELDLKNYIDTDSKCENTLYKLISISTHMGDSSEQGHYIAYCLNEDGKYYLFNDSYVKKVQDEKELYEDEPYLLFYQKEERIKNKKDLDKSNSIGRNEIDKLKENFNQKINKLKNKEIFNLTKGNNYSQKTKEDNNSNDPINEMNKKCIKKENFKKYKENYQEINKQIENSNEINNFMRNEVKKKKEEESNIIENDDSFTNLELNNQNGSKKTNNYQPLVKDRNNEKLIKEDINNKNEIDKESTYVINISSKNENKNYNNIIIDSLNENEIKNIKIQDVQKDKENFIVKIINIFIRDNKTNKKYQVNYHPGYMNKPLIFKLTIKGPEKTIYQNSNIEFQINLQNLKFNDCTFWTTIETKIYHLNFYDYLNIIPFNYKYASNESFYYNMKNYFLFLCDLFVKPNLNIWIDVNKAHIYKNNIEGYEKSAKKFIKKL